jgi:PmbA protein
MLDTAVRAVKDLESMGASEAESYVQNSREVIISKKGENWSKRKKKDTCIGLRTLINKKKGFAAGTYPICSLEEIEKASFVLSKNAAADPSWEHLPFPKPCIRPEGIYDKSVAGSSEEEIMDTVQAMADAVREGGGSAEPTLVTRIDCIAVANSHGVERSYQSTRVDCYLFCTYKKGVTTIEWHSRAFDVNVKALAQDAAENVLQTKNFSKIDHTFTGKAIFLSDAVARIFFPCIKWAVHAENVYSRRSRFTGKGEEVASPVLTIVDDGTLPAGLRTAPFDGEGNPMQKTSLIEGGVFKNVLHSEYTANRYGEISTGNALRSATTEPSVGITNMVITPGDDTLDALIEQVDEGVLVRDFSGDVDPSGGYFDGRADGSYIRHGEVQSHVNAVHIRGNAFKSLLDTVGTGRDQQCTPEGIYTVPLLTSEIEIIQEG